MPTGPKLTVYVSEEFLQRLKDFVYKKRTTQSAVCRTAIEQYVSRNRGNTESTPLPVPPYNPANREAHRKLQELLEGSRRKETEWLLGVLYRETTGKDSPDARGDRETEAETTTIRKRSSDGPKD